MKFKPAIQVLLLAAVVLSSVRALAADLSVETLTAETNSYTVKGSISGSLEYTYEVTWAVNSYAVVTPTFNAIVYNQAGTIEAYYVKSKLTGYYGGTKYLLAQVPVDPNAGVQVIPAGTKVMLIDRKITGKYNYTSEEYYQLYDLSGIAAQFKRNTFYLYEYGGEPVYNNLTTIDWEWPRYEDAIIPFASAFSTMREMTLSEAVNTYYVDYPDYLKVSDGDLTVVHEEIDRGLLICKDNNGYKTAQHDSENTGYIDFMNHTSGFGLPADSYDQSYYVALYCSAIKGVENEKGKWAGRTLSNVVGSQGKYISGLGGVSELKGLQGGFRVLNLLERPVPSDQVNTDYTVGDVASADDDVNLYVPASFSTNTDGVQQANGRSFFFVRPKIGEVADVTWAVWSSEHSAFLYPKQSQANGSEVNKYGLTGGVYANFTLNTANGGTAAIQGEDLEDGQAYQFRALVGKFTETMTLPESGSGSYQYLPSNPWPDEDYTISPDGNDDNPPLPPAEPAPRKANSVEGDDSNISQEFIIYPLDLIPDGDRIVTGVRDLASKPAVAGVEYVNIAGERARKPFTGINIVVTRYTDGTTTATKIIR